MSAMNASWETKTRYHTATPTISEEYIVRPSIYPGAAEPPRHPPAAGGGHILVVAPFTSATISSQRGEIKKRNFAHIFLNT